MSSLFNADYFAKLGISLDPGLSDSEINTVENTYQFVFPPDIRRLLQFGLPVGDGFVDWRNGTREEIQARMEWPFEGICFDIENNSFWLNEWGERPSNFDDRFTISKRYVDCAPTLIPIYSHRYIPDSPNEVGNPIFSVHQTDIFVYGSSLEMYLQSEFGSSASRENLSSSVGEKQIEFWSHLVNLNNGIDDAV